MADPHRRFSEPTLAAARRYREPAAGAQAHCDRVVQIAAALCNVPMAAMALLSDAGTLFLARTGIATAQAGRLSEVCTQVADPEAIVVVADTAADASASPAAEYLLAAGIRFFASAPLRSGGVGIGALCVLDGHPHQLSREQVTALSSLCDSTIALLDMIAGQSGVPNPDREHELRSILDQLPYNVYWMDTQGRVLGANRTCLRDLNCLDTGDLTDYGAVFAGEVADLHVRCRQQVVATGKPIYDIVEPRLDASGQTRWLSGCKLPMFDAAGRVTGILASYVDVTATRRTEEALRTSEGRFRRAVEAAPTAMLMADQGGSIVMVNNQAELMFGRSKSELMGKSIDTLVPMRARSGHSHLRAEFLRDPVTRRMGSNRDVYAIHNDGSEFPVEIGLGLVETEGGPVVLAAITDITLRKQAQQQLEAALQEKTVLLNEIHHRVKNNLQVISSLLNLQANATSNENVRSMLIESQNRIQAMALTHQLLYESKDFSRINLGEYLQRISDLISRTAPTSTQHIKLVTNLDTAMVELPRAISCGLIVNELLTNAFKHAFPDGRRGQITVELMSCDHAPRLLRIADDGIGIPAAVQVGAGTSLGLQLVPMLVEQAGATMQMTVSEGTEFIIDFEHGNRGHS
jgi:PAS domain S-box-containing protein